MTAAAIKPASGSKRTTRLVPEDITGQTPDSAAWSFLRNTGGAGVSVDRTTDESAELPGDIVGTTDIQTTAEVGVCAYDFELSKDATFEVILESLLQAQFSDVDADKLYAGNTERTLTVEDEFPSVKSSSYTDGLQIGSFNLSVVAGQQTVTGSTTGRGSTAGIAAEQVVVGSSDIGFAGSSIAVGGGLPSSPTPSAGDFVRVSNVSEVGNLGYFQIANVVGNDVIVKGSFTTETATSAQLNFTGQTQFAATSGTGATRGTSPHIKSGNQVALELSEDDGTTWRTVLDYGLRIQQLDMAITAQLEDQLEIQEDNPFISVLLDKSIEWNCTYHLINQQPRRWLDAQTNLDIRLSLLDKNGNGYRFRLPRAISRTATSGDASKGQSMAGEWTLSALLKASTNRDLEIERL